MKKLTLSILLSAFAICLFSCKQHSANVDNTANGQVAEIFDSTNVVVPKYAEGFRVKYLQNGVRLLEIEDPQKEKKTTYRFALLPQGIKDAEVPSEYTKIHVPVKSMICMTSLQLSNVIALDACDKVLGITSTRHLFNKKMNEQLKSGKTAKIGIEGNFDNEVIMGINPDVIFISPFKRGGYDAMRETGIPLVPHLGYKEMTPLGQAEWVKFISLFIDQEKEANALFDKIVERYDQLKKLASSVKHRPTVFSGEMRGGNWYAVGGKSFLAQLFNDAGATYFLKDNKESGGVTLDFETVYSQADQADFWRIVNSFDGVFSYDALKAMDPRYADFKAFKDKAIVYCNMRDVPFYENMPMEPQEVLADLIHIFHPELLPDHKPVFYHRLK